ncbi:MAG: flavin reductase family protein [Candidatus Promineifilaceae bacterium]|nr:flavin reductase family protein [Candidatus Promineifilaceae bacterium]
MILKPDELIRKDRYKLLIGTVLPRPIAWVSSMDEEGNLNLAPFSYFTVAATNPMTLIFCPQIPDGGRKKDTWRNIEQVPEFVVNITNEETAERMNLTATTLSAGESEFDWAGLTPAPSETVRVPRVAEAPVSYECTLQRIVTVGDGSPGTGAAIFGEVQCIHIRDDVYDGSYVTLDALKPIGRLAGSQYTRVTDLFSMKRVPPPEQ